MQQRMIMKNKAIYIASPLGFSEVGRLFMHQELFPIIKSSGYDILDPWKLPAKIQNQIDAIDKLADCDRKKAWQVLNPVLGRRNAKSINESIGLLAVLDGVDVDSGTASEIGYAAAKSKPILGYRGDFRLSADNEGSKVNLQVEYFIRLHKGNIVTSLEGIKEYLPKIFK